MVTSGERADRLGLILANADDSVALWICDGLSARGLPTQIVTSEQLCTGARWTHAITGNGSSFAVRLADGRQILSERIRFVLNRLTHIPGSALRAAQAVDNSYAEQEWRALLASVMQSIPPDVPILQRANPYALGGRWHSPAAWAFLAGRAGFAVGPWRWHDLLPQWAAVDRSVESVFVVGERVLSLRELSPGVRATCLRLAELAQACLLQIVLSFGDLEQAEFCGAQPSPDLRVAGDQALDALALLVT